MEEKVCKFCNAESSMGNESLGMRNSLDIYIYTNLLCILEKENPWSLKIKINHCPMCGKKL